MGIEDSDTELTERLYTLKPKRIQTVKWLAI